MGNRILKESVLTSRGLSSLSWFEQVMFDHLIVTADDYGIFYADPTLLAHILFPRSTNVTEKMVREGLEHMEAQQLIFRYTAGGEEFLKLCSWEKHQRLRSSRRKFPAPEEADPENTIPEETVPVEAVQETPAAEDPPREESAPPPVTVQAPPTESRELPVAELPLNDNTTYGVTREEADEYARLYPAVDVRQELRNMRGWCLSNPQRRKTRSGIRKFINGWLSRAQNAGGGKPGVPVNPFLEMLRETEEQERRSEVS